MGSAQNLSETKRAVLNRLRSAEGHLHRVIQMYEAADSCEEVLQQLHAVEAALSAAGRRLRDSEFQRCAEAIMHSPDVNARVGEVNRLIALCRFPKQLLAVADTAERNPDEQTEDFSQCSPLSGR